MWFQLWLKGYQTRAVRPRSRRLRETSRLRAEVLEDRRMLAFIAPVEYSAGADGVFDAATADFNNDGRPDLVTANYDNSVSVLLGDGQGGFGSATLLGVGNHPRSVAVGDFNDDGNMDLATANQGDYTPYAPPSVSVLLGNGDGTFGPVRTIATEGNAHSVAVGDFNADGNLDLGVGSADYYAGYYTWASVHTGDGAGNFSAQNVNALFNGIFGSAAADDLNGDGADDLVVGDNRYGSGVYVFLGAESGSLHPAVVMYTGSLVEDVAVGDLNGDGILDIAAANSWYDYGVSVMLGNGQGGFSAAQRYGAGLGSGTVVLGDFTGDGHIDIVFGGSSIVRGFGDGTFSVAELNPSGGYSVAAADMNGDGWLDVISRSYNTVSVSLNDQTWGPVTPLVSVSVSDASITEGKRGVKYLTFTVTLSAASNAPVTMQYVTQNGTATAGSDYQALSGVLTFAAGETRKTVSIAIYGDNTAESDETFQLLISNVTGAAVISDAVGVGTIVNDDIARGGRNARRLS
jgi:hypothetical protein